MSSALKAAVQRAISGDVAALATVSEARRQQVFEEAGDAKLVVGRESVGHVLRSLGHGEIDGEQARRWALFVWGGFVPVPGSDDREPAKSLPIEWDPEYEEAIAEIISRLEQIGDIIDGDIPTEAEINEYLVSLGLPQLNLHGSGSVGVS